MPGLTTTVGGGCTVTARLGDTVVAGDESAVAVEMRRYAEAGATKLILFPSGSPVDRTRTAAVFAELARKRTDAGYTPITLRYARGPLP